MVVVATFVCVNIRDSYIISTRPCSYILYRSYPYLTSFENVDIVKQC